MSIKIRFMEIQDMALCLVSKWWRPVSCIGIAGGAVINLVIIPLRTWTPINMVEAAAYVAATTAAFGIRSWEKRHGIAKGFNH
jgi:hypothetical protein